MASTRCLHYNVLYISPRQERTATESQKSDSHSLSNCLVTARVRLLSPFLPPLVGVHILLFGSGPRYTCVIKLQPCTVPILLGNGYKREDATIVFRITFVVVFFPNFWFCFKYKYRKLLVYICCKSTENVDCSSLKSVSVEASRNYLSNFSAACLGE